MAFEKISNVYYIADLYEDLAKIEKPNMGAECLVISEACEYKSMSTGEWVKQIPVIIPPATPEVDLTGYATEAYVDKKIAEIEHPTVDLEGYATEEYVNAAAAANADLITKDIKSLEDELKACYEPKRYNFSDLPTGSLVDYRGKEIRIYCPANAKFNHQQPGEGGNPNLYYMTFTSYAPEGAVSFKEGDRGVLVDELLNFETTAGTGIDKFGRKYKNHWFALASYDEDLDVWTYFGNNSTTSKYIGWTFVSEWYDANGNVIGMDKIRINLANADCYLALDPYFG